MTINNTSPHLINAFVRWLSRPKADMIIRRVPGILAFLSLSSSGVAVTFFPAICTMVPFFTFACGLPPSN
jgi:hypothetical protein